MMKDLILPEGQKYLHSRRVAYEKYTQFSPKSAEVRVYCDMAWHALTKPPHPSS